MDSGRDPRIAGLSILVAALTFTFAWLIASSPTTVMGAPCGSLVSPSKDADGSSEMVRRCADARGRNFVPSIVLGIVGVVAMSLAFDQHARPAPIADHLLTSSPDEPDPDEPDEGSEPADEDEANDETGAEPCGPAHPAPLGTVIHVPTTIGATPIDHQLYEVVVQEAVTEEVVTEEVLADEPEMAAVVEEADVEAEGWHVLTWEGA